MPGAVIGAVAGEAVKGIVGGSASKKAAKTQAEAADRSLELQKEMYDQTREDLAPYRASGNAANKKLAYLMGLDDVAFDRNAVRESVKSKYFGSGSAASAGGMGDSSPTSMPSPEQDPYANIEGEYILPTAYVNTFVPQRLKSQFLKPQKMGAANGNQLR